MINLTDLTEAHESEEKLVVTIHVERATWAALVEDPTVITISGRDDESLHVQVRMDDGMGGYLYFTGYIERRH